MSRYRLVPTVNQEAALRDHCAHARFVWNLAVEQQSWWRPGRASAPGYLEQCRQLTAARAGHPWLAAGPQMVQQQALRDFAQAMANYSGGTHDRPSWRKAGRDEGFRVVAVKPEHVRLAQPEDQRGLDTEGGVDTVPLVPRSACGREVLPGDDGPRRALACRLCGRSCSDPGARQRGGCRHRPWRSCQRGPVHG